MTQTLKREDLAQFHGTYHWYRHGINRNLTYTDGVKYVAETAGAYWLVDDIAIHNMLHDKVMGEEFQVWKLKLNAEGHGAVLSCEDGNYNVVYQTDIEFTDFPLDSIDIWVENNVMMLPTER